MAQIPKDVQEFLAGKQAWVATADADGMPNTTIKGTAQVIDDEHVIFADLFSLKTRANLKANPKVAVAVADEATGKGYQIKGTAQMSDSGDLFKTVAEKLKAAPMKLPPMQYVVYITVESVYDQSVGPNAGKQIA